MQASAYRVFLRCSPENGKTPSAAAFILHQRARDLAGHAGSERVYSSPM